MGRKQLDLINLPQDPQRFQELIETVAQQSEHPIITYIRPMPLKRNALLRPRHEPKFELTLLTRRQGALIQSRGYVAENACVNCEANKGPFTLCVLLDTLIGGGCANCFVTRNNSGRIACCSLATEGTSF